MSERNPAGYDVEKALISGSYLVVASVADKIDAINFIVVVPI